MIAGAVMIVGVGIAFLGLFAERGTVAMVVGMVIFVLGLPLWKSARKMKSPSAKAGKPVLRSAS